MLKERGTFGGQTVRQLEPWRVAACAIHEQAPLTTAGAGSRGDLVAAAAVAVTTTAQATTPAHARMRVRLRRSARSVDYAALARGSSFRAHAATTSFTLRTTL